MQNQSWIRTSVIATAVAVILFAPVAFAGKPIGGDKLSKCSRDNPISSNVIIKKSVDGDTVWVQDGEDIYSVRMLGIDTPETHYMGQSQGVWGEKAAQRNQELIPAGTKVRLEFGAEPCDNHGRVLAHIFKGKMHINAQLVKEGLAVNYCVAPEYKYCDDFDSYITDAMEQREGMFSDPNAELPYDFRRRVTGNEQRSFVGNQRTKQVRRPGNQNSVPVGARVFFYTESLIKSPYYLVE